MSTQEPWYKDGIHFTCTQCGNCCTGAPGVVWVSDEEIRKIADLTGRSTGEIRLLHTRRIGHRTSLNEHANGDCTFFDGRTRRCTIYQARPTQCRTWPFWKSNLSTPADWESIQKDCPGAGRGAFVSLEQIELQKSQIEI